MSYIVIGDPHYSGSDVQKRFWSEMIEKDVNGFVILGDLFTNKRKMDALRLWEFREILDGLSKGGERFVHIVTGNHDRYYADVNEPSNPKRLFEGYVKGVRVFDEPGTVELDGEKVLYLPHPFGAKEAKEFGDVDVIYAHGEIRPYYPNATETADDFGPADYLSGHYHKHVPGVYLGTPYSIDYSDLNEKKFYAARRDGKFFYHGNENDAPFVSLVVNGAGSAFCPYTGERFPVEKLTLALLTGKGNVKPAGVRIIVPEALFGDEILDRLSIFMESENVPFSIEVAKKERTETEEGDATIPVDEDPVEILKEMLPKSVRKTFETITKEMT